MSKENIICPRCGKDNTQAFRDQKLHTSGYECLDCHRDFGVDNGKDIEDYEKNLSEFYYSHTDKKGFTKRIRIKKESDGKVLLSASAIDENGFRQPYDPVDVTSFFDKLKDIFFRKCFILDWDRDLTGLLLPKGNEKYEIRLIFSSPLLREIKLTGTNKFPPYFKIRPVLFGQFFLSDEDASRE